VVRTPAWARTLERLPPALRHRLAGVLGVLPAPGAAFDGVARQRFEQLIALGEGWLGAEPAVAELGYWMIDPRHTDELRRQGCRWLAQFPSAETVRRVAAVALDAGAAPAVREQAIASLGARELCGQHAEVQWLPDAVQLADEALVRIASEAAAGRIASEALPRALRHVACDGIAAVFARAPGQWSAALEWYASPPLARVLAVSIEDIPALHRVRVLRLVAATLGAEAIPVLLARLGRVTSVEQLEILFLALAFTGDAELGRFEDAIRGARDREALRGRARWHLEHRGLVPTVRGLRVARTSAVLSPVERAARCAQAADDLAALTRYQRHEEPEVYTLWAWMVRGAGDPAQARELVAAHPASQALVGELYVEDLARRGRVRAVIAAAHAHGGVDHAALQLAIWGRPLAALELAAVARVHTPELACARALACHRAGRPDLGDRILAEDLPPSEPVDDEPARPFPGPHEQWLLERAPERPALAALAGGRAAVVALAQPAPHEAEADAATIEPALAVARRLDRELRGRSVYLAGEIAPARRERLIAALAAAGARRVAGPAPGTDFYLAADGCPAPVIARLERQGVRRLPDLPDLDDREREALPVRGDAELRARRAAEDATTTVGELPRTER
jgi:hypothetical protein